MLSELLAILPSHLNPPLSTLMERFRFNNRNYRVGEALRQFVAALPGLASVCAFGDQLYSLLRDHFACGINNHAMHTRLLELPDPSLNDVVKVALAMEPAVHEVGKIATGSPSAAVNKLATKGSTSGRCGGAHSPPHSAGSFKNNASRAGKLGTCHAYPAAREAVTMVRGGGCGSRLHVLAEDPPIFDMWRTGFIPSYVPPYMLTVKFCGHRISMELDTGASVSVMSGKQFKRTFPGVPVESTVVILRIYSRQLSQPGVGIFTGPTAGIYVPEGARPRFFKPRLRPFSLKDGVTQELQWLQLEGILVPVKTFEWATPIVPVLKRDGSVRINGDSKVTVNPVTTDLLSALSGEQQVTKFELRDAYQGAPAHRQVDAVVKAPKPQNKELLSYLSLMNFDRSFLPTLS
ncbi:uncharacterized protein LOC142578399 [Dermacentor variabilis]|uniref:uncharacterized protein LOC142578399 n=1 Tax=Dermacentor variabilis TaxID=34621 RepID=UPI003F5BC47A